MSFIVVLYAVLLPVGLTVLALSAIFCYQSKTLADSVSVITLAFMICWLLAGIGIWLDTQNTTAIEIAESQPDRPSAYKIVALFSIGMSIGGILAFGLIQSFYLIDYCKVNRKTKS